MKLCITEGYHFPGISGNLELLSNSAKVTEKVRERAKIQGNVREFV